MLDNLIKIPFVKSKTAIKIAASFIIKVSNQILMFVLMVLLARFMGGEQYGVYVYFIAWINILLPFSKAGIDFVILKHAPGYIAAEDWGRYKGIINWAMLTRIGLAVLMATLFYAVSIFSGHVIISENHLLVVLTLLAIPIVLFINIYEATLKSLNKVVEGLLPFLVGRPSIAILIVLFVYYSATPLDASIAVAIYVLACLCALIAIFIVYTRNSPVDTNLVLVKYDQKSWYRSTGSMFAIAFIQLGMYKLDIVILGEYLSIDQVGYYSAGARIAELVFFGQFAINAVLTPMFSEAYHRESPQRLRRLLVKGTVTGVLAGSVLLLLTIFIAPNLLLLFGNEFTAATTVLYILATSSFVMVIAASSRALMMMSGKEVSISKILVVMVVLNIVLDFLFIPRYGINGAAVATLAAQLFAASMILIVTYRKYYA